jgi:Mrp family chromosome partitioning ATPase
MRPAPPLVKEHDRVRDARAKGAAGDGGPARAAPSGPAPSLSPRTGGQPLAIPGIKHLIAVASGKGGVGKSTTAVNLALGLQAIGLKAGIMDADIYGPSQPRLLGLSGQPEVLAGNKLKPKEAYGLKAMSMGFMVDEGTPVVWRGPMVVQALNQMLREVAWGDLDVLVATSVIEVGIDVPRATIMTILDAESFGLAQLHQLRGRVARGRTQGICGAVTAVADVTSPRVEAFVATADGFALAEQDLLLRGPGELVGERQSGSPPLYLADLLRDTGLVAEARRDALELHARDPDLADPRHERLREVILARWGGHLGLGQIG